MSISTCSWALYKGLWHTQCSHFYTTTDGGELNYTFEEIPPSRRCPRCGEQIEVVERQFGRRVRGENNEDKSNLTGRRAD